MSRSIPTEDRIGSLPDSILHHILSFLPTKSAASTTILSKRWNPLWLSIPTLHFDDTPFKDFISFRHFISSVFLLRDITLPIQSFHLKCSKQHSNAQDINRFIHAAVQRRGIEELDLKMFGMVSLKVKLPASIFSCKTLVVLNLRGVKLNDLSQVFVDLPRLKTLHLYCVVFKHHQYIPKFLSRCPILEELHIKDVLLPVRVAASHTLILLKNFQYLPNLIRADIYNANASVLFTLCCRAQVLRLQLDLTYLKWNFQIPMYHNLIYIKLILKNNHPEKWNWLLKVLNHCPKLQNLTIHEESGHGYEVLDNWMNPTIVPECLITQLRTCLLKGYKNTKSPNNNEFNFVQNGLSNM
ncbi:hypothetical protein P8452_59649 [Trifolium repens]|nr:hypothetical protein P8452_59649 [Trifolium repens]